ncbi:MAG: hypothetical protein ACOH2M_03345 [Cypionkella sp.]
MTTTTVNAENILKVADAIEQHSIADLGFNMGGWVSIATSAAPDMSGHNCGTVACVAGWACAVILNDLEATESMDMADIGALMGLDGDQSFDLFIGQRREEPDLKLVSQDQAVRTLRNLAVTGEVDWTV